MKYVQEVIIYLYWCRLLLLLLLTSNGTYGKTLRSLKV